MISLPRSLRGLRTAALAAVAGSTVAALSVAAVVQLTLREMLQIADGAVLGTVIEKKIWSGPVAGFMRDPEFTTLVIQGEDLLNGGTVTREVTYLGSDRRVVSEMPSESETRAGARVVAFSKSVTEEWGGRKGLHSVVAAHGGVFRVEAGPKGDVVLGKGEGFAVSESLFASELRQRIAQELATLRRR